MLRTSWPVVCRLLERLLELRRLSPALRGLSADCLQGDPDSQTLFLLYSNEATGLAEPIPASLVTRESLPSLPRRFGSHGIRIEMRFDRGPARRCLPMMSVCDFGDEQISLMTVEGPPTSGFRELENAIWGAVYDEVLRYEHEADALKTLPTRETP